MTRSDDYEEDPRIVSYSSRNKPQLNLPKASFDVAGNDGAKIGINCAQISTALKMHNHRAWLCWEGKEYLLTGVNFKQFAFDEAAQVLMKRLADSGEPSAMTLPTIKKALDKMAVENTPTAIDAANAAIMKSIAGPRDHGLSISLSSESCVHTDPFKRVHFGADGLWPEARPLL